MGKSDNGINLEGILSQLKGGVSMGNLGFGGGIGGFGVIGEGEFTPEMMATIQKAMVAALAAVKAMTSSDDADDCDDDCDDCGDCDDGGDNDNYDGFGNYKGKDYIYDGGVNTGRCGRNTPSPDSWRKDMWAYLIGRDDLVCTPGNRLSARISPKYAHTSWDKVTEKIMGNAKNFNAVMDNMRDFLNDWEKDETDLYLAELVDSIVDYIENGASYIDNFTETYQEIWEYVHENIDVEVSRGQMWKFDFPQ